MAPLGMEPKHITRDYEREGIERSGSGRTLHNSLYVLVGEKIHSTVLVFCSVRAPFTQ